MVDGYLRSHPHPFHATALKPPSGRATNHGSANRKVCFSFAAYARNVIDHLTKCQVPMSKGLADEEFRRIEKDFGFCFPPDLRSILQEGLPVGVGFPNWRSDSEKQLRIMLNLPVMGLCYEIARGKFWWKPWGSRPADTEEALEIARRAFKMAPILVPIYCHCYIPCSPNLAGNPIFFIYEKDIFYCGYDLADFFEREVFVPLNSLSAADRLMQRNGDSLRKDSQNGINRNVISIGESVVLEQHQGDDLGGNQTNSGKWTWELLSGRLSDDSCSEIKNGEVLLRKSVSEEPLQTLERPETLVRSAGNSPRMGQNIMSRYTYFHEQTLPTKLLKELTVAAPPWAAKTARRIQLWSSLVESKENSEDLQQASENLCCSKFTLEVLLANSSSSMKGNGSEAENGNNNNNRSNKRWLRGYFKDLEKRLKGGGWKEEEIEEMVDAVLPGKQLQSKQTGQEVRDAIVMNVESMSVSLRKAGWSAEDVSEIFSFNSDLSLYNCRTDSTPFTKVRMHKLGRQNLGDYLKV